MSGKVRCGEKFDWGVIELTGTLYTVQSTKLRGWEVFFDVTVLLRRQKTEPKEFDGGNTPGKQHMTKRHKFVNGQRTPLL